MDLELRKRKLLAWAYVGSAILSFVCFIFFHEYLESGHSGMQFLAGYIGGSALVYSNFCLKNGLRPGGNWQTGISDWFVSLVLAVFFAALIAGVIWAQAAGGDTWLMLGIISSFYLFQVFVESWWSKLQEITLLAKMDKRIADLERRLRKDILNGIGTETGTGNRDRSEIGTDLFFGRNRGRNRDRSIL